MKDRLLRLPEVAEMLCVSKSTVWQYAREGQLPKAIKLSPRVSVWRESDVCGFIDKMFKEAQIGDNFISEKD